MGCFNKFIGCNGDVGTSHMNDGRQPYVSGTQLVDPLSMVTPNLLPRHQNAFTKHRIHTH
jgi:hypothetical protein